MLQKGDNCFILKQNKKNEIIEINKDVIKFTGKKAIKVNNSDIIFDLKGVYEEGNFNYFLREMTTEFTILRKALYLKKLYADAKDRYKKIKSTPNTRLFKIGEEVNHGCITEIFEGGKFYLIEKDGLFTVFPWMSLYKETQVDFELTYRDKIRISFCNQTISSLLNKHYSWNIDFNPFYQRDDVWDELDKKDLINSIFEHIEIGKFAFIENDFDEEYDYEVLDGKQRLSALIEFYEDRFKFKGKYFSELSVRDKEHFLKFNVSVADIPIKSKLAKLKYFYNLNSKGKIMSKTHLQSIKEMIEVEKNS